MAEARRFGGYGFRQLTVAGAELHGHPLGRFPHQGASGFEQGLCCPAALPQGAINMLVAFGR